MPRSNGRKARPPLDAASLEELALTYVGRFGTTRWKLRSYLLRKLRERGWDGSGEPPVEGIVERFAARGYVDDAGYALAKARSMSSRGYGGARIGQALRAAGVDDDDGAAARELADSEAGQAALRYAQRRRIGPFAESEADRLGRERALAAMVRAGHSFDLARRIVALPPGSALDEFVTEQR